MARPNHRRFILSIAATSLLALPVHAQSPQAEALFGQADSLEKQGKTAEACDAFAASNRIEARAGTLIRLGACREQNHQLASAWSAYKDALTRVKDATKRKIATEKVAELEPRLSYLTVKVTQMPGLEITRDGQPIDPGTWNLAVPTDGGTFVLEAHAPGRVAWKETTIVPLEHGKIVVDVPALAEDKPAVVAPPPVVTTPPPIVVAPPPPPREDDSAWTGKRKAAVVVAGVAVLAGVGGVVLGSLAKSHQNDAAQRCPDQTCDSDADLMTANRDLSVARSRALDANIAFGVAGAAAITARVLWLVGGPEHQNVSVAATPGSAMVTFAGRF